MIYMWRVLYAWLLPPGLCLLLFLVIFLIYLKTKNKSWLVVPFIIMYLLSTYFVSSLLIKPLEDYYKQPLTIELKDSQAIIILGGGSYYGVPDVDESGQLTPCSANRLLTGVRLHKLLKVPIIISGTKKETEISSRILRACDINDNYIFIENRSGNTVQNAIFTKAFCQRKEWKKLILITSAYHLPRATQLFQREGIVVTPYPTDFRTHGVKVMNMHVLTPTYEGLSNSSIALKEYLGIFAVNLGIL